MTTGQMNLLGVLGGVWTPALYTNITCIRDRTYSLHSLTFIYRGARVQNQSNVSYTIFFLRMRREHAGVARMSSHSLCHGIFFLNHNEQITPDLKCSNKFCF